MANIFTLLKDTKKRWLVIIPVLVVLFGLGWFGYYELVTVPAQNATPQPVLQTSVVRRGNLTLSASGTGTLTAANLDQLSFGSSGTLITLNVKVGDQVTKGQLLAAIENSSQLAKLAQAQQALDNLTSPAAISNAQKVLAKAQTDVYAAQSQLIYLESPRVFWDNVRIAADQTALDKAKAAAGNPPTADQQKVIDAVLAQIQSDQHQLAGDKVWYTDSYLPNIFTTQPTRRTPKSYNPPTDKDVANAQTTYDTALYTVQENQWYVSALTGGTVPDNATGAALDTLIQAQITLENAKQSFSGTKILAPFAGMVTVVNNQFGDAVSANTTVITVEDTSQLFVQTYIDETDYAMFQIGNPANVVFSALPNTTLIGKVVEVDPALATSSGATAVRGLIELEPTSERLLMGMSGAVTIIGGNAQNAVLVPVAALFQTSSANYFVYVVKNGNLVSTPVTIGLEDVVNAEVKSGLQPGDVVATGNIPIK